MAYSPLFDSTFTLTISVLGLFFNLICSLKLWWIFWQNHRPKSDDTSEEPSLQSTHILSHKKYRFLFILTCNDLFLCLSSIISCLDERYFFQALLARYHLCAAHILLWKLTLHLTPLLIVSMLCRYHYILRKQFQVRSSNLSTLNQLLCTDLSILIPIVLAIAWSVDGLWLWGVSNIKDYVMPSSPASEESINQHESTNNPASTMSYVLNTTTSSVMSVMLMQSEERNEISHYLPQQTTICYLQTDQHFSVRLVRLIQADFLLLFSLHLTGLLLEILLHVRVCCCVALTKVSSALNRERQLCVYILYIFLILTFTSFPFYLYRTIEIVFDTQLTSINNEYINSRTFAQILLIGTCFKPILFFILFFPSSILFKLKCYLKCYSATNIQPVDKEEQGSPTSNNLNHTNVQQSTDHSQHHRYSLMTNLSIDRQIPPKARTQSSPIITTKRQRQDSLVTSEDFNKWWKLTNSVVNENTEETGNIANV